MKKYLVLVALASPMAFAGIKKECRFEANYYLMASPTQIGSETNEELLAISKPLECPGAIEQVVQITRHVWPATVFLRADCDGSSILRLAVGERFGSSPIGRIIATAFAVDPKVQLNVLGSKSFDLQNGMEDRFVFMINCENVAE